MLIDTAASVSADPATVEAAAVAAEAHGYDGFVVAETRHDAFVSLTLAARAASSTSTRS